MNTRRLSVSTVLMVCLSLAAFVASPAAAASSTGVVGDQAFYSPAISRIVFLSIAKPATDTVYYSKFISNLINRESLNTSTNQVFYSPFLANVVNLDRLSGIPNQVFYSPMIESFTR